MIFSGPIIARLNVRRTQARELCRTSDAATMKIKRLKVKKTRRYEEGYEEEEEEPRGGLSRAIIILTALILVLFVLQHQLLHLGEGSEGDGKKIDSLLRPKIDNSKQRASPPTPPAIDEKTVDLEKKLVKIPPVTVTKEMNKAYDSKKKGSSGKGNGKDKGNGKSNVAKGVYNFQPDWGFQGEEKYIKVVPNNKIHLKWERRILFPDNMTIDASLYRTNDEYAGIASSSTMGSMMADQEQDIPPSLHQLPASGTPVLFLSLYSQPSTLLYSTLLSSSTLFLYFLHLFIYSYTCTRCAE